MLEIFILEYEGLLSSYNTIITDMVSSSTTTVYNYAVTGLPLLTTVTNSTDCATSCDDNTQCVAAVQQGQTCNLYAMDASLNIQMVATDGDITYLKNNVVKMYLLLNIIEKIRNKIQEFYGKFAVNDDTRHISELMRQTEEKMILDERTIHDMIAKSEALNNEYQTSSLSTNSNYILYQNMFGIAVAAVIAAIIALIMAML